MELDQLRYFCAIAEAEGFSRAAERIHISQPSLSQQIRKLEDELGARLFDRLGRTVRLTELGRAFLPHARAVLRELEAATGEVLERQVSIGGTIRVGVIPTIAPYFLPPLLAAFSRKLPQARITVIEEITPLLLEKLRAGAIDASVVALPLPPRSHEFDTIPLLTEKLFAVLPKRHPRAQSRTLRLEDLRDEPFLLLRDGHCFRETAVAACKRAHLTPQIIFESGQFSTILSMVGAGLGVSIVPEMAIEKRPGCRYIALADSRASRTIGAITLRGKSSTRLQMEFVAHLRESMQAVAAESGR
jgi:LysR family transcriptional regulator, hydrogen peroxide-inducible genes activator